MNTFLLIDEKIVKEFQSSAIKTKEYPHDYGEMRELRIKLQELCGITEIEALNILIDRNVGDYIRKYSRTICTELVSIENNRNSISCSPAQIMEIPA